jgi:aryl-alcohol dehydrogenase-like predicted oxidoreductase
MTSMAFDSYVTLGRSGLRVSRFGLGSAAFGQEIGYGVTPAVSERIIDRYLDKGGNFIDTANVYSRGHAELIVGDYFARQKHRRDRAVIATKFTSNLFPGDPNGGGASRRSIIAQCEESLRRLQTDRIDLFWMHVWDRFTPIEESMSALDDLVRQGKVRYLGFSNVPAWKVAQAQTLALVRNWTPLIALELEYSLLERTIEGEHVPMALELGLGIIPWGTLRSGVLSGAFGTRRIDANVSRRPSVNSTMKSLVPAEEAVLESVGRIASARGASMASVALAWVKAKPGIAVTLLGIDDPDQLDENATALELVLSAEEMAELDRLSQPKLNYPHAMNMLLGNSLLHAGATVNGSPSGITALQPNTDTERF